MTDEEKAALKIKIEQTLESVRKDIADLEELTKPISPENAIGRVSRMDAINNKSVNEASLRQARVKAQKLTRALEKIDAPDFGICQMCKRPIQQGRLMFMPESVRCVKCADR